MSCTGLWSLASHVPPIAPQVFKEHCWNDYEADNVTWRLCYSDEHYFATTLAVRGLDEVRPAGRFPSNWYGQNPLHRVSNDAVTQRAACAGMNTSGHMDRPCMLTAGLSPCKQRACTGHHAT